MRVSLVPRLFREFAKLPASDGILLFACAIAALVWANSPWAESYHALWRTKVTLGLGQYSIGKALLLWINDGLMAVFFFMVGLEIKRELLEGDLASPRQAALSIAGAAGGMVVPAGLYLAVTAGTEGAAGWGIPMATDIAFALGVLALLGTHAPAPLKVFVTALAIVDDLGAIGVIALFYTAKVHWQYLAMAALPLIALVSVARFRLGQPAVYVLLGLALWVFTLLSGIHATIAGVLLALTIPLRTGERNLLADMEHAVHPWVAYLILPVFALANAGVSLQGDIVQSLAHPVSSGIVFGLVVGKPLGVTLACWLAVRMGVASLPPGVGWSQLGGAGLLAGIGFTMSLFIGGLAFSEPSLLDISKLGILTASLLAGIAGSVFLVVQGRKQGEGGTDD